MRIASVTRIVLVLTFALAGTASAQQHFQAIIDGVQEVPSNASAGTGIGCFTLDANSMLNYVVTFAGLGSAETGAHIHGPAPMGVNAGVVFPFGLGTPKIGSFGPLNAVQVADLSAGLYYVNIHSQGFPGGEIRGQILPVSLACTVSVEEETWSMVKRLYNE